MRIADVSIRRPVFAVMLIGGLVVLGLISIPRLGLDLYPRVEFPMVTVTTVLEGAAPDTVEREVSQVLEEAINTIEGINTLRSASSDSLSLIFVEFGLEYEVREKAQEVRDKVAAVRGELPRDVEMPVVERVDPDSAPILAVMIAGPHSIRALSELADKRIKTRLERIPGVGSVTLVGAREREIRIWIDPLRLSGYGLAVDDVLAAVGREHVELPGGRLETDQREWALRTQGKLRSAQEFGAVVLAERAGGVVKLRDVATVEDGMADERTVSRLDGRRGVSLLIRRQSGANTVAVADAVKREIEAMRRDLPPGYEAIIALDSSDYIRSSVIEVAQALAWGALLAALVVLLFLRSGRSTMITAIAIPTSLVASFVFFYAFGFTLNTMTLMALSLSIGLLIDDAIVVLENIYRHIERGTPPMTAASQAVDEIGLAVVATTLSICGVFVPIAFLSGVVGRFFREFGIVAAVAVCTSTLVALTLTPMLCSRFVQVRGEHGQVWKAIEAFYVRLEKGYRRLLGWGMNHRPAVVALALVAVVGGIGLARAIPTEFLIADDRAEFNVWVKLPLGSTVQQTLAVASAVERDLRKRPEVAAVFSTVGAGSKKRVNEAEIYVQLTEKHTRVVTQQEIMVDLRGSIRAMGLPIDEMSVDEIGVIDSAGMRNAQLMYSFRGPDIDELLRHTTVLIGRLERVGGYADLSISYETGKPEVSLRIERERAADLGVSAVEIARTVSTLFAGYRAATFEEGGERYDVRVQVLPEFRDDIERLELVQVRAPDGHLVPLRNLVRPSIGSGPVQIDRENRARNITLFANLDGKTAGQADREISAFVEELGLGSEIAFEPVGPSERLRETAAAIAFAFVLALIAIYMILASQFNSFVHPFIIMLSAPLSFVGAFAILAITRTPLDLMGQISFLMLMGIVMKNGILLVDYTNTLRSRGLGMREAVLQAGPVRMRPVLMTAASTICGMLPVALGSGPGSEWRNPMGLIAIGGLFTSTFLTLLIVPVAYSLVDDAQRLLGELFGAKRRGKARS